MYFRKISVKFEKVFIEISNITVSFLFPNAGQTVFIVLFCQHFALVRKTNVTENSQLFFDVLSLSCFINGFDLL